MTERPASNRATHVTCRKERRMTNRSALPEVKLFRIDCPSFHNGQFDLTLLEKNALTCIYGVIMRHLPQLEARPENAGMAEEAQGYADICPFVHFRCRSHRNWRKTDLGKNGFNGEGGNMADKQRLSAGCRTSSRSYAVLLVFNGRHQQAYE